MSVGRLWNGILDRWLPLLSGAQLKVLCYVLRHTIGFQKVEDAISLEQFMHGVKRRDGTPLDAGTGLSKKTLLAALRELEELGVLLVTRRQLPGKGHAASVYRVAGVEDSPETPAAPKRPQGEATNSPMPLGEKSPRPLGEKLPQEQGTIVQGNKDHQAARRSERPEQTPLNPPTTPDDDLSISQNKTPQTPVDSELMARVRALGVSASQARRLFQRSTPEKIQQCLEYLPYRNARNPAGYLVREVLSEEGFATPRALEQREQRIELEQKRKAQAEREALAKEAESQAYRAEKARTLSGLTDAQRHALAEEARRRATWARNPGMLAEGSPILEGLMLDLVAEGWLEASPTRSQSKLALPQPSTWSTLRRFILRKEAVMACS